MIQPHGSQHFHSAKWMLRTLFIVHDLMILPFKVSVTSQCVSKSFDSEYSLFLIDTAFPFMTIVHFWRISRVDVGLSEQISDHRSFIFREAELSRLYPRMNPHQQNKVDISVWLIIPVTWVDSLKNKQKLSADEQRLFRLYGKLPNKKDLLQNKLKVSTSWSLWTVDKAVFMELILLLLFWWNRGRFSTPN